MADIIVSSQHENVIGTPQNNGAFFDGTYYWVFYTQYYDSTKKYSLYCKYGTSLDSMSVTNTNPSTPNVIPNINNNGKAYSILFGQVSGTWYAWALVNQSDDITGKAFTLFRWELTSGGLANRIDATASSGDKASGHVTLTHDYGSATVTNIYGAVQAWNSSAATRQNNAALSSDTGMGAVDSSVIDFPEFTIVCELSDGWLAVAMDEGAPGEISGDYGHLREWTKATAGGVGGAWSSESTIEGSISGASSGNGDATDLNYATNTSHAGQIDGCQIDDGSLYVAYIDNADTINGDHGLIKLISRGNAIASGWTLRSSDLIGSSGEAWHLSISTNGTDVWVFYVKDGTGSRDGSIYYRKYDVSGASLGTETKVADIQTSHTFERMFSTHRAANDEIVVVWSEDNGDSTWDALAASVTVSGAANITTTVGSVEVTGVNAAIAKHKAIVATVGSVDVTGVNAVISISSNVEIVTTVGNVQIAGVNASLNKGVSVSTSVGSVTVTGVNATIDTSTNVEVSVSVGSVQVTGVNAVIEISGLTQIITTVGSVTVTGTDAVINKVLPVSVSVGNIDVTGINAAISKQKSISASVGSVELTGVNATIVTPTIIVSGVGSVAVTGFNATVSGLLWTEVSAASTTWTPISDASTTWTEI